MRLALYHTIPYIDTYKRVADRGVETSRDKDEVGVELPGDGHQHLCKCEEISIRT